MFPKSFVAWMDEHKDLREMIANGKDKLEWSRQVALLIIMLTVNLLKDIVITDSKWIEAYGDWRNLVSTNAFEYQ